MPSFSPSPGVELVYDIDDFTDPWAPSDTVVMVHGLAERAEAWRAWVPHLARRHRVVRLDLRGYGRSTPMDPEFPWALDVLVGDLRGVLDHLGLDRAHLVGGKIGGTIAMSFAAKYPARVKMLAAIGAPASLTGLAGTAPGWRRQIREEGVEAWARASMRGRMGSRMSAGELAWWTQLMARTAPSTLEGFLRMVPTVDVTEQLPRIAASTLVVTTTGSGLGSVDEVRRWQQRIPKSRLAVLPGDSYHVAASDPDLCAAMVATFLEKGLDAVEAG